MTANYQYYDEEWQDGEWVSSPDFSGYLENSGNGLPFDIVAIAAVFIVILGLIFTVRTLLWKPAEQTVRPISGTQQIEQSEEVGSLPASPPLSSPQDIIFPYDDYIITQGIHGQSYGQMAIDIAAGKGAIIKSPISGIVSAYYFDEIGNPTLIIENDKYRITMLHGNFSVAVGDELNIGDPVGTEGNLGNTKDMQGRSCRNRDCGYHTHLNVFDKEAGTNINPLEVIGQ